MIQNEFSKVAKDLTRFLDEIVSINVAVNDRDYLELKIDILEKIIQIIRHEVNYAQNNLTIDQLLQFNIVVDNNDRRLYFDLSQQRKDLYAPDLLKIRNPDNLQASLIVFLLLNFRSHNSVLCIIEAFIDEIKPSLTIKDFEKTKTGVIRCFTNTRFAAKQLRDYGLLKFTREEAYKRWELSFLGVLVAVKIFEESWRMTPSPEIQKTPFDVRILNALKGLKKIKGVRGVLEHICMDKELFPSFEIILQSFERLAKKYEYSDFSKNDLNNIKSETASLLSLLEKKDWIETFMKELSLKTRIDECMLTIRDLLTRV